MEAQTEILKYSGVSGNICAKLFSNGQDVTKFAVVLPGARYSYRGPLLRFAIQILLKKKYRVLALDKIYGDDSEWSSLKSEEQARKIVEDDTIMVFQQIISQFRAEPVALLGRSLGTYAIACLLERQLVQPSQIVWQSPALASKWEIMRDCKIPSLGILGSADFYYQKAIEYLPKDRIVIDRADHGMEIPGDPIQSIEILKQVSLGTYEWLK